MVDSGQTAYNSNNVNTRQNEMTWGDYLCTIRLVACRCTHDGQCRYEVRCGRLCGHGVLHQHRFVPTLVTTARLAQEVSPPYVRNVYVIVMLWKCDQVLSIISVFPGRLYIQMRYLTIPLPLQACLPWNHVYNFGGSPHFVCQLPPGAQQLSLPLL